MEPPLEELAKLRKPEEPEEVPDLKGRPPRWRPLWEAVFNGETPQYEGVGNRAFLRGKRPEPGPPPVQPEPPERRTSPGGERPAREGGRPKEEQQSHRSEQRKPRPERQPKGGESREKAGGKPAPGAWREAQPSPPAPSPWRRGRKALREAPRDRSDRTGPRGVRPRGPLLRFGRGERSGFIWTVFSMPCLPPLVLLMLMSVGYFMGARGWMNASEKKFISKYIVNIAVPCNCLTGLLNNLDHDSLLEAGVMVVAAMLGVLMTLLLSLALAALLRLPRERWGSLCGHDRLFQHPVYRPARLHPAVRRCLYPLCDALLSGQYGLCAVGGLSAHRAGGNAGTGKCDPLPPF